MAGFNIFASAALKLSIALFILSTLYIMTCDYGTFHDIITQLRRL